MTKTQTKQIIILAALAFAAYTLYQRYGKKS